MPDKSRNTQATKSVPRLVLWLAAVAAVLLAVALINLWNTNPPQPQQVVVVQRVGSKPTCPTPPAAAFEVRNTSGPMTTVRVGKSGGANLNGLPLTPGETVTITEVCAALGYGGLHPSPVTLVAPTPRASATR